jgi:hypothetical protein
MEVKISGNAPATLTLTDGTGLTLDEGYSLHSTNEVKMSSYLLGLLLLLLLLLFSFLFLYSIFV